MLSYNFLLDLALILLSTKLLGLLTKKVRMPQVVGALLAGLLLGPAVLGILNETEFIVMLSELGVIVLMFTAGLETNIKELKKTGMASFVIAILGVIIPLAGGFITAEFFNNSAIAEKGTSIFMQNIFIGIILTATSVSITVETLKELKKLNTKAGNAILGAAIIDDILGIIGLTIVTSFADPSQSETGIVTVLLKIFGFLILSGIVGFVFYRLFDKWVKRYNKNLRRFVIVSFVFCLIMSFVSEKYFGVADITGAFIAGLIISNAERTKYIASRFETLSYILLSPIFFASIGIKVVLPAMSASIIWFSIILLIVAVLTKIIGCGLGAKACKFNTKESLQIGVGMISRGEVALIVASKGAAVGLMSEVFFGPIIIMVVITTIITPILLKIVFKSSADEKTELYHTDLMEQYEESYLFDLSEQVLLDNYSFLKDDDEITNFKE